LARDEENLCLVRRRILNLIFFKKVRKMGRLHSTACGTQNSATSDLSQPIVQYYSSLGNPMLFFFKKKWTVPMGDIDQTPKIHSVGK
jgi:hypothetical protein